MAELLSEAGLERFGEIAASHVGDEKVPGMVAIVARRDQVRAEVLGSLSIGGPAVKRDSLFRASMIKLVTAAAILALAAEGLFRLDDPVDILLPELSGARVLRRMDASLEDAVPAARSATIRELLTFTFGFGAAFEMYSSSEPWPVFKAVEDLELHTFGPPRPAEQPDPETWIAVLGSWS